MEETGLNITQKEFKQLCKWAENVYNIVVVVDYYCETQPEKEECYNLAPIVKYLHHEADLLKIVQKLGQKCKNSPANLKSINLPLLP